MNSILYIYVAAFMLINIVSFLILIAVVNSLVTDYSVNSKLSTLKRATNSISVVLKEHFAGDDVSSDDDHREDEENLKPFIRMLSLSTDALLVMIVDDSGEVRVSAASPTITDMGLLPDTATGL